MCVYSKKYSPIPRNASENEPQATCTRVPLLQILPLHAATAASLQDIRGIGKVK